MRVLVVEDEVGIADLLARALGEISWACDVVGSGTAARAARAPPE
jgi:DNA-binding response OmpR family regulator